MDMFWFVVFVVLIFALPVLTSSITSHPISTAMTMPSMFLVASMLLVAISLHILLYNSQWQVLFDQPLLLINVLVTAVSTGLLIYLIRPWLNEYLSLFAASYLGYWLARIIFLVFESGWFWFDYTEIVYSAVVIILAILLATLVAKPFNDLHLTPSAPTSGFAAFWKTNSPTRNWILGTSIGLFLLGYIPSFYLRWEVTLFIALALSIANAMLFSWKHPFNRDFCLALALENLCLWAGWSLGFRFRMGEFHPMFGFNFAYLGWIASLLIGINIFYYWKRNKSRPVP